MHVEIWIFLMPYSQISFVSIHSIGDHPILNLWTFVTNSRCILRFAFSKKRRRRGGNVHMGRILRLILDCFKIVSRIIDDFVKLSSKCTLLCKYICKPYSFKYVLFVIACILRLIKPSFVLFNSHQSFNVFLFCRFSFREV